ncbi:MAG: lamin tail domain-containing protein [Bacteroidia bacterium]|nr:lamin tail domain-containing protein [Bacteroidia bacterium]
MRIPGFLFLLLISFSLQAQNCVFISEYIEGAGLDKCIEIYNGSGAPIDLAADGYEIRIYTNGSPTVSTTIPLTGTVAAGATFVVCNPGAAGGLLASAQQQSGLNFNGDDAVGLFSTTGALDVIGQIGFDPGTEWNTSCPSGTADGRLRRNTALPCPSFDGQSAFDPSQEWICDAVLNDSDNQLGTHTVAGCALSNLSLTKTCNAGVGGVSLSFNTSGSISTQFTLTVAPDPGGLSGTYNYASLPLILGGFAGDSLTGYSFTVSDVSGSCTNATITDVRFDCPVADILDFSFVPTGCIDVTDVFELTVCAIESATGKVDTSYSTPITISLDLGANGTVTGNSTITPVNGCATFGILYNVDETISFTASSAPLFSAGSGQLTISLDCPGVVMQTGVINPCGEDSQNEFVTATTGSASISVADIELYSIDPNNGPQPNTNYTWSANGTSLGGNPAETCGTGLQCNRWLDINIPADAATIALLVGQLNTQAACTPTLFVAPTGANLGTIPPNSNLLIFLGAGGNPGTIAPGFDGLGTNLDFTGYCSQGPIYVIFGEHQNPSTNFGFFANNPNPPNTGARTYQISTLGNITSTVPYPSPSLTGQPEIVDKFSNYSTAATCTPPDLFGPVLLEAEINADQQEKVLRQSRLRVFPNPTQEWLTAELPFVGPEIIRVKYYSIDGKSTENLTFTLTEGNDQLTIDVRDLSSGVYFLELLTERGAYRTHFIRQ